MFNSSEPSSRSIAEHSFNPSISAGAIPPASQVAPSSSE
jgi:hypothetical protein